MANQQEEFLEKLETIIRTELKNCVYNPFEIERQRGLTLAPPPFFSFEVWKERNLIFVKAGKLKGGQAKIIIEKSNNDLRIVSSGFKFTKKGLVILTVATLLPAIFLSIASLFVPADPSTKFWTILIVEGFFILLVMGLKKTVLDKRIKIYNEALRVCIKLVINQLE